MYIVAFHVCFKMIFIQMKHIIKHRYKLCRSCSFLPKPAYVCFVCQKTWSYVFFSCFLCIQHFDQTRHIKMCEKIYRIKYTLQIYTESTKNVTNMCKKMHTFTQKIYILTRKICKNTKYTKKKNNKNMQNMQKNIKSRFFLCSLCKWRFERSYGIQSMFLLHNCYLKMISRDLTVMHNHYGNKQWLWMIICMQLFCWLILIHYWIHSNILTQNVYENIKYTRKKNTKICKTCWKTKNIK